MKIKAAVINKEGEYPVLQDHEIDVKADEVIVDVIASALNHRDLWIVKGQYGRIQYPIILGSDGCVSHNGGQYLINPGLNWGDRQAYQGGDFDILGMPSEGCFAEKVQVSEAYLHEKPSHMSVEEAAALPLGGLTAYRALFSRAQLQKGEKVFISGIGGGVALFAMQFAVANGNEVYVSSSSEEKIAEAISLGASGGYNYKDDDMHKQVLKSVGPMDVIIDSAGGPGFSKLVNITAKGARISIYGGTRGEASFSPQRLFWNQASILGTTMGSDQDFSDMLEFVNKHQIKPVIDKVYPIDEIKEAILRMKEGAQFGKIVIKNKL
ncbi:quinone oxidoreductase family protein [Portibacter lacus]|uniref:Alcohol dehydrogenase n=1 Tax=Portibacter lacus TaxID=1099794 RepID=A0AA37WGM3_9BACT|nr:zinc-binding dehydrogenase [Portibacter lacus]GLR20172.1 alcohol dehydrogenase [Portibacter lacus]